jgi:hypothetical protein
MKTTVGSNFVREEVEALVDVVEPIGALEEEVFIAAPSEGQVL